MPIKAFALLFTTNWADRRRIRKKLVGILPKQLMDAAAEKREQAVVKSHYGVEWGQLPSGDNICSLLHTRGTQQISTRLPRTHATTRFKEAAAAAEKGQKSRLSTENPCLSIKPVLITQTMSRQMNSYLIRFVFWFGRAGVKHIVWDGRNICSNSLRKEWL